MFFVCMGSIFSASCSSIISCFFLFLFFFASRGLEERQLGPPGSPEEGDCGGAGEAADYALL